jgi:hypothetical protein
LAGEVEFSATAELPAFLSGGGKISALMRAHDWSTSPLFTRFTERFNRRDLLLKRPDLASHSINEPEAMRSQASMAG